MSSDVEYPFVPKSTAHLRAGQFWAIPLDDGRFACGRVVLTRDGGRGSRTWFLGGIHDWVGDEPPTARAIVGAPMDHTFQTTWEIIRASGGEVLGWAPLDMTGVDTDPDWLVGESYAALAGNRMFVHGLPEPTFERREVTSPLTSEMLAPMTAPDGCVQFSSALSDRDLRTLGRWFDDHPHVGLRAYGGYDGSITDLEFLEHFPNLSSFSADALHAHLESLDGLRHLSPETLRELVIGETRKRLDLASIAPFTALKWLFLERQHRNIEVVSGLTSLEHVTLRSITLPDLSLLLPLANLRALELKLGGTADLGLLPRIGRLQYFEAWQVRGLTDLSPVSDVLTLRYLALQSLRQVTELPDLSRLVELRRVVLDTMKGLSGLEPLAQAPALTDLLLISMGSLDVEAVRVLQGHPTLRGVTFGFGSKRKNEAAHEILPLPRAAPGGPWRDLVTETGQ